MTIYRAVQSARRAAARRREREEGQMLVVFVLFLIVVMLSASIVIDLGMLRNTNQKLWNALDAGALAGVSQLPDHAAQGPDRGAAVRERQSLQPEPDGGQRQLLLPGRLDDLRRHERAQRHPRRAAGLQSGHRRRVDDGEPALELQRLDLHDAVRPARGHVQHDRAVRRRDPVLPLRQRRRHRQRPDWCGRVGRLQGPLRRISHGPGRCRPDRGPDAEHERRRHVERQGRRRFASQPLQPRGPVAGSRDDRSEPERCLPDHPGGIDRHRRRATRRAALDPGGPERSRSARQRGLHDRRQQARRRHRLFHQFQHRDGSRRPRS